METKTLTKTAGELTTEELQALLNQKQGAEAQERQQKREAYEALRNETTMGLVESALRIKMVLKGFKTAAFAELEAIYKLLQEHSSRHADGKGNFTIETEDKLNRVRFTRHEQTRFDERATQAEAHILDFLTSQFGDDSPTSKLVRKLLERKKGALDKNQVLQLISMKDDFDNENWRKGIELLAESIVPDGTKYYVQFFNREAEGDEWQNVVLDFAKL